MTKHAYEIRLATSRARVLRNLNFVFTSAAALHAPARLPSGSTRLTVAFLYSFPSIVLKSSASASDEYSAVKITSMVSRRFIGSLAFASPDEFPKPRNLSASVAGLNDPQARGQCHKTLCP
jgi:hypothetical protein